MDYEYEVEKAPTALEAYNAAVKAGRLHDGLTAEELDAHAAQDDMVARAAKASAKQTTGLLDTVRNYTPAVLRLRAA